MDHPHCIMFVEALAQVPDPCQRRGQRDPWVLLLTLLSGQRTGAAISQWVTEHRQELRQHLAWPQEQLPRTSTLRVLRQVDVAHSKRAWRSLSANGSPRRPCRCYPRIVEFVDALPRSRSGKILWRELQEQQRTGASGQ